MKPAPRSVASSADCAPVGRPAKLAVGSASGVAGCGLAVQGVADSAGLAGSVVSAGLAAGNRAQGIAGLRVSTQGVAS